MAYTETAAQFFERISHAMDPLKSVGGVIEFEIEGAGGGTWLVDLDEGKLLDSGQKTPQIIVRARERDFMALIEGRMSASDGMLTERLHIAGDLSRFGALMSALETVQTALA